MATPVQTPAGWLTPGPHCAGCALQTAGTGYMRSVGQPHSGLIFVGEALGHDEAIAGQPFVGNAGHLLNKLLRRLKLRRDHVLVSNVVWCRPPDNDLDAYPSAIQKCLPHLVEVVAKLKIGRAHV